MKARCAILVLTMLCVLGPKARGQDFLEPEEGVYNLSESRFKYAQRVREVLLKDPRGYHLARMLCQPALRGTEWVVTIVREEPDDFEEPDTYYVEYVCADQKLYPPRNSEGATAKRYRAPIDRKTAEAVNRTWRAMLRRTRYPEEPVAVADGVDYHFSRFVPMIHHGLNEPLAGWEQGKTWSPDEDSCCGQLVAIGERLKDYTLARPEDREKIRVDLRERSKALEAKVSKSSHKSSR